MINRIWVTSLDILTGIAAKGPVMLLIHPFFTDSTYWKPQVKEFMKTHKVITLDLFGFGKSSFTQGEVYVMDDYVKQIAVVLLTEDVDSATVVGQSTGCYVALALFEKYPDMVNAIGLCHCKSVPETLQKKLEYYDVISQIKKDGTNDFIKNYMGLVLTEFASDETKKNLYHIMYTQSSDGVISALHALIRRKSSDETLAKLKINSYTITSVYDKIVNATESEEMYRQIDAPSGKAWAKLDKLGHFSSFEKPAAWNVYIRNLIPFGEFKFLQ